MDTITGSIGTPVPTLRPSRVAQAREWLYEHRLMLMVVVLPTLLVSAYYLLIAANQYESEAHFIVRSTNDAPRETGLGQALSLVGAGTTQTDAFSVGDYLTSHDAVAALEKQSNLIARFRRPEADFLSVLPSATPSAERLLRYYRGHVDVNFDSDTGIAVLKVRTFRPEDSYALISDLLRLGEQRVNSLNERSYRSTLGVARRELDDAEAGVAASQRSLTAFRQGQRDIDPQATGQAQIGLVSQLQIRLAQARALESAMAGSISPSSPQMVAQRARVAALTAQVNAASGQLTGNTRSIAAGLGDYQSLQLRQQFAAKRYDAAAAGLERARQEAEKQQLFIVRVVQPNMPEKALYPKSAKVILTVFFGLLLLYGIGWLIAAGVREHAA